MKPRQRQAAILEHLQSQGKCSVEELAQHFDTTGTTIRKDLVILENAGTVIRTYGGVVLNKDEADPPIDHKTLINTHKKERIAEAAVSFIHDGDSITVTLDHHRTKIRLNGIDAPELRQPRGVESRDFLARLVLNKDVQVKQHGQDRYQRTLADISIDGKNVNQALVAAGFAWWYRKYAAGDTRLRDLEAGARSARLRTHRGRRRPAAVRAGREPKRHHRQCRRAQY